MYSRRERDLTGRFVKPWRAAAAAGRAKVWADGGFMRGSDVVKAIALGAKIGRTKSAICHPDGPGQPARDLERLPAAWSAANRLAAARSVTRAPRNL